MGQFSFEMPWALGVVAIFILCAFKCKAKEERFYFPHIEAFGVGVYRQNLLLKILKWLGIVLVTIALASPVTIRTLVPDYKEGRDIVLVLDASESMRDIGFDGASVTQNRFSIAIETISNFVANRKADRIGLVTFADVAFVASPLTFDKVFLDSILQMQEIGIAGRRTALYDAILQSYGMLEKSEAKSKIIIVLTDGVDNMSEIGLDEILSVVKSSVITPYVIGIGRRGEYDANVLYKIATQGGGSAFEANDAQTLMQIYQEIDRRETTKLENAVVVDKQYLFIYPLFFGMLCLLFFIYLKEGRG